MNEFGQEIQVVKQEVSDLKGTLITRDEFNSTNDANAASRALNFQRIDDRITAAGDRHNEHALAIERRLGEVLAKIAELRPQRRQEGPERRQGF